MQRAKCKFVTIDKCENNVDESVVYMDENRAIENAGSNEMRRHTQQQQQQNLYRLSEKWTAMNWNLCRLLVRRQIRNYSLLLFFVLSIESKV